LLRSLSWSSSEKVKTHGEDKARGEDKTRGEREVAREDGSQVKTTLPMP